jgi:hypothetical protein
VSTIAAEQHIDEILDLAANPDQDDLESSDISDVDDGHGHDDDHSSTIDDADSQHLSRQGIDCLTLKAVLDGLIVAYNQEIPLLDSSKYRMVSSLPFLLLLVSGMLST